MDFLQLSVSNPDVLEIKSIGATMSRILGQHGMATLVENVVPCFPT